MGPRFFSIRQTGLLLLIIFATTHLPAQPDDPLLAESSAGRSVSYAPLALFTNGPGRIVPFQDGQLLRVGREYFIVAIPDRGYVFTNWNQVNVFTLTSTEIDYGTSPPSTNLVTSINYSPLPPGPTTSWLQFTMEPEQVLYETDSISLTLRVGWQANFVLKARPRARGIR